MFRYVIGEPVFFLSIPDKKHALQGWKHCIELPRLPRTVVEQYKYIIDQLTTVLMISCLTPSG